MSKVEKYTIGLEINGVSEDLNPSEVSFSLRDSIHSLYSEASLKLNDSEGWILEGRGFTNGSNVSIVIGYDDVITKSSFIVRSMETPSISKSLQLGGELNINMIHESYKYRKRESKAYKPNPSKIVENLFDYVFTDTKIESTKNVPIDRIYRPYYDDEKFIKEILLPNSLSTSGKLDPYFSFIDINGIFHYRSFLNMMNEVPSYSLKYGYQNSYEDYNQMIYSMYPFSEDLLSVRDNIEFSLSYFDSNTKEYKKENINIINKELGGYPIYSIPIDKSLSFIEIKTEDMLDRFRAHICDSQRESLLPEKMIVILPLFTEFTSGKTVSLDVKFGTGQLSYSFSKNYLIERSDHVWNGESNSGFSQLVLSKALPEFPTNSVIEEGIYQ